MKQIEIVKAIFVQADPEAMFAHLADIKNHPGLQPLVVETQEIERTVDENKHTIVDFFSVELFRFLGLISYRNKIRVKMIQVPEENLIIHEVESFPNITLISHTTFEPENGGTAVAETIQITTPNIVAGYVEKTADAAHDSLMQNLKTRMESDISSGG